METRKAGTQSRTDTEASPDDTVDITDHEQLRQAIKARLTTYGGDISVPKLLILVGISRGDSNFEAFRKALSRFLESDASSKLDYNFYVKLVNFFRDDLPDHDILAPAFYKKFESKCGSFHQAINTFHSVASDDLFAELKEQAQGRFFLYKRPVNPLFSDWVVRSYCRIWVPSSPSSKFMMVAEHQNGSARSKDVGMEVLHDFYFGTCTKKHEVLVFMLRHSLTGAIKNIYFNNTGVDSISKLLTSGYGIAVETCPSFTPGRFASSGCVLKRIPDTFTFGQIRELTKLVPPEEPVDPEILRQLS